MSEDVSTSKTDCLKTMPGIVHSILLPVLGIRKVQASYAVVCGHLGHNQAGLKLGFADLEALALNNSNSKAI